PALFGRIMSVAVDARRRVYILDAHAQEVRVFDRAGQYLRTIGREGGGPGEFKRAMAVVIAPSGDLWVLDPGNARISAFDTAGAFLSSQRMLGGYFTSNWQGGFDDEGLFYTYMPDATSETFRFVLAVFDAALTRGGTFDVPTYRAEVFSLANPDGRSYTQASIPYTPKLVWLFDPRGLIWFSITGEYRVYQRTLVGDTVRIIEHYSTPVPIASEERDSALVALRWFVQQGGKIDATRLPTVKPAIEGLFLDTIGNLWVLPTMPRGEERTVADIFDEEGRYLGRLRLPFRIKWRPAPTVLDDMMYAVIEDDLGVEYVVVAAIDKH
ncbi:MAG: 6-bladed beta-propeller, partial [Anaerolineae bacterium]|nr:6-bladed beta-propeller [Anaerolineae bacterium]